MKSLSWANYNLQGYHLYWCLLLCSYSPEVVGPAHLEIVYSHSFYRIKGVVNVL